jgi:hypothetical protein
MFENAKVCKNIGGFVFKDFCYIANEFLEKADIYCNDYGKKIPFLKSLELCSFPLSTLDDMPKEKIEKLVLYELERITPTTRPEAFVVTDEKQPGFVGITTTESRPLTKETLKEAIDRTLAQQEKFRAEVGSNWFPCGFTHLHLEGRSPLVLLIKRYGEPIHGSDYRYLQLRITKGYPTGYNLYFDYPERDATECQSMTFQGKMYGELQRQLALLGIRADVESRVD